MEDEVNEHAYHSEYFILKQDSRDSDAHVLNFTIPIFEPLPPQYFLRIVSDRCGWFADITRFGCEMVFV